MAELDDKEMNWRLLFRQLTISRQHSNQIVIWLFCCVFYVIAEFAVDSCFIIRNIIERKSNSTLLRWWWICNINVLFMRQQKWIVWKSKKDLKDISPEIAAVNKMKLYFPIPSLPFLLCRLWLVLQSVHLTNQWMSCWL